MSETLPEVPTGVPTDEELAWWMDWLRSLPTAANDQERLARIELLERLDAVLVAAQVRELRILLEDRLDTDESQ